MFMRTASLTVIFAALAFGQQRPALTTENAIAFCQRAEGALFSDLRNQTPLVEAYFQRCELAKNGRLVPREDSYALGRFTWTSGPKLDNLFEHNAGEEQHMLNGMVRAIVPDWRLLTPDRYGFQFVRVAFLGALRCLLYDVKPLRLSEDGFRGRIYLEDKTWNVVRFTGMIPRVDTAFAGLRSPDSTFRVDAWRVNVNKHQWVPAYVYVEEVPPLGSTASMITRGQIRFWGYEQDTNPQQETSVDVRLTPSASAQEDATRRWLSPAQSNRDFENQAERNVLDRLAQGTFLGTTGVVETMLDQVITNLVVTNHLTLAGPVHCCVLLTTPLEVFTAGNTIVISRGLIDVLPSESALALILAHQLAHNVLGHQKVDTRLAFSDVLRISDRDLLAKLRFQHPDDEESAADRLAMKLLEHSPYKETMEDGSLFLQAVQESATHLTSLIQPHFGEHVADAKRVVANNLITRTTPVLDHGLVEQIAALPLGSKLIVNPWNGQVALLTAEPLPVATLRERNGFGITAFTPFLEYLTEKPILAQAQAAPAGRTTPRVRTGRRTGAQPLKPSTATRTPTAAPRASASTVAAAATSGAKGESGKIQKAGQLAARR